MGQGLYVIHHIPKTWQIKIWKLSWSLATSRQFSSESILSHISNGITSAWWFGDGNPSERGGPERFSRIKGMQ
jgi:hypothetical protein